MEDVRNIQYPLYCRHRFRSDFSGDWFCGCEEIDCPDGFVFPDKCPLYGDESVDELKQCPFCHNIPVPVHVHDELIESDWWYIECRFPPPSDELPKGSYRLNHFAHVTGLTKEAAIKEWNARSPVDSPEENYR
jgi:hypothetical protein